MVKIVFFMFDKNKNGDINKDDMIEFLKILHNESSSHTLKKNIKTALNSFKVKRDGTVGFLPVVHWCRVFPSVMEPAFRLQGTW
jgi:Ca2+-binding EF-hand superfamily protein